MFEFDGTFEGFLTLLAYTYEKKIIPEKIVTPNDELALFDEPIQIKTDHEIANKAYKAIKEKFHKKHIWCIKMSWLHDTPPLFLELLLYLRQGFKNPSSLNNITYSHIKKIQDASTYVSKERHKMLGFVRFVKLQDDSYYAKINPKSNIISLLGTHFKERFNDNWIIHDIKRNLALTHEKGNVKLHNVASFETPTLHENEHKFQHLWKEFFKQVAIKERENKKLQNHFVPLFYRDLMVEF